MCSRMGAPLTTYAHFPSGRMTTVIPPLPLNLNMPHANRIMPGDLRARHLNQRRLAIIFRSGGVVHSGQSFCRGFPENSVEALPGRRDGTSTACPLSPVRDLPRKPAKK
jgi:hypothetical protein